MSEEKKTFFLKLQIKKISRCLYAEFLYNYNQRGRFLKSVLIFDKGGYLLSYFVKIALTKTN